MPRFVQVGLKRRTRVAMAWTEPWPYWTTAPQVPPLWGTRYGVCVGPAVLVPTLQDGKLQFTRGQSHCHQGYAPPVAGTPGPRRRKKRQDRRRSGETGRQGAFSAAPSVLADAECAMAAAARAMYMRGGAHRKEPATPERPARLVLNV